MQDCKRNMHEYRSREARFFENYEGKYRYGENTVQDYVDLQGIFLSHALMMAHPITYSCLYAFQINLMEEKIEYLNSLSALEIFRFFLKADLFIFNDIVDILDLTVVGVVKNEVYL